MRSIPGYSLGEVELARQNTMHYLSLAALAACLSGSAVFAQATSPIAALYLLDETSGSVASDVSPFRNNGTLINFTGNPWGPGQLNNGLTFDGVDDYVDLTFGGGLPIFTGDGGPYSVAFWVKGPPQDDRRFYSEGQANPARAGGPLFTIGSGRTSLANTDRLQIYIRNAEGPWEIARLYSNSIVLDDTWHHVAWVDVAGVGKLYVDGVLDTGTFDYTVDGGIGIARGTRTPDFGTFGFDRASLGAVLRGGPCCHFQGSLDDVRMFRYALEPADVTAIMQNGPFPLCRPSVGEFGVSCGATSVDLVATGRAAIGSTLTLQLQNGVPGGLALICFGFGIAPLDLTPIGLAGCRLYPFAPECVAIGALDAAGSSTPVPLPIPTAMTLLCGRLDFQGLVVSAGGMAVDLSADLITTLGQ